MGIVEMSELAGEMSGMELCVFLESVWLLLFISIISNGLMSLFRVSFILCLRTVIQIMSWFCFMIIKKICNTNQQCLYSIDLFDLF